MTTVDFARLDRAYQAARSALLAERTAAGYWIGELSTSALSTAVAVSALALVQKAGHGSFEPLIANGLRWLAEHQNADGGWGDTVKSVSNISTTMLCRAAFHLTGAASRFTAPLEKSSTWLGGRYGTTPEQLAEAIRARYGVDRTFSVPILMTSALAGLVGWHEVPSLTFELACFPQSWFRFLQLPVVSYALPALIAIGQAVFHHRPPWNPLTRATRSLAIGRSLRVLEQIQPSNGGFLEATPLTAFVTLGLASSGRADHPVVRKAVEFLVASVRPDGSWPIDTNLSTWVTTLSINALAGAGDLGCLGDLWRVQKWLIAQQGRERHPFTGADPGAWGWTPLPGSVPDADDTPGALLALWHLASQHKPDARSRESRWRDGDPSLARRACVGRAEEEHPASWSPHTGLRWLLDLQNRDGGWPTFCRGWGRLPFDRSGTDLTGHALRALHAWQPTLTGSADAALARRIPGAMTRGLAYLERNQRPDGSWLPLWFGNQHAAEEINPTYGTARVLAAYHALDRMSGEAAQRGVRWLLSVQQAEGGWGGVAKAPPTIEETALAVEALLPEGQQAREAVNKGLAWLVNKVESSTLLDPAPIGFYFARLWYFEKLYPLIWTVAALGRARHSLRSRSPSRHGEAANPR
jgi:squalene-hopene/tetraprenyl-beta-curcumene cyclase